MTLLTKNWSIIMFVVAIIYATAFVNADIAQLKQNDIEQKTHIEKVDGNIQKIEVDVSYIRAWVEKSK
jgi:hypothetical protein